MSDVLSFAGTGGAIIVFFWLAREPLDGAPLWTWQAWRLPDPDATFVDLRTIRHPHDALPVLRHTRRGGVWPDQGMSIEVADVAAIRQASDWTSDLEPVAARRRGMARPIAVGAVAGLAVAGGALPVPYVLHTGRPGWTSADVERFKTEFKASLGRAAMVLHEPVSVAQVVDAPAPSDVMILDMIQLRLSAGLSNVVAAAMATLMEGATA